MKSIGVVRKIDPLGRLVLPAGLREALEIKEGTPLEIFVDGQDIYLKKYEPACIFCGETQGTILFKEKVICQNCINNL